MLRVYPHPKSLKATARDMTTDCLVTLNTPQTLTPSRIGIVVSKKVAKLAVSRNRIKRQVRAIFRQVLSQLSEGLQIIVTVSTIEESPNYGQLCNDLTNLLKKAGILHGD